jgi:homospermidine synthase
MGEVGKCTLHLMPEFIEIDASQIHIVERNNETAHPAVNGFIGRGARYLRRNLTPETTLQVLEQEIGVASGDLIIDLTTDSDMFHTVELCLRRGWRYLNTCIENSADAGLVHHRNHAKMAEITAPFRAKTGVATCVFDHGMNPGLISAFAKKGLEDIARLTLESGRIPELEEALRRENYSELARLLKLETLHLSELDDQKAQNCPRDVFVNTWSCPGFLIEALAPVQVTWGSHEKTVPPGLRLVNNRVLISEKPAWQFRAESHVPGGNITGMLIPHEEILTLKKLLATKSYAPTIAYVYAINPHTRRCFDENLIEGENGVVLSPGQHGLTGMDKVGALFVLAENPLTGERTPWSWWSGTILETTDPVFSATVIQVAAGVLAAVRWMMENPNAGIRFPEDMPHAELLRSAAPHLGTVYSAPVPYLPSGTRFEDFLIASPSGIPERLLR